MPPHAGMHVEVDPGTSVEEADRIGEQVRTRNHEYAETGYCVIQMEAAKASPSKKRRPARCRPRPHPEGGAEHATALRFD